MSVSETFYSIEDLSRMTGVTRRTIRYYIQEGLLDKPIGERRAAHYSNNHLETLLRIRRLTAEGLSLEAVKRNLIQPIEKTKEERRPGGVRSCIHVTVAHGVELVIDPSVAPINPTSLRRFVAQVEELLQDLNEKTIE